MHSFISCDILRLKLIQILSCHINNHIFYVLCSLAFLDKLESMYKCNIFYNCVSI